MALKLVEGFDHLQASLFTTKGWTANPGSVTTGRVIGNAAVVSSAGGNMAKVLPATATTGFVGFGYNPSGLTQSFFNFDNAGVTTVVATLATTAGGLITVKNSGGTVIATGTTVLSPGSWYYVELEIVVNGASGSCTLQLNGATEIATTTGNFGSTAIGSVSLVRPTTGTNTFDDLYFVDTTGTANNTFLGDTVVETLYASADGAHTQWTPSTGTAHFSLVNENTGTYPDGDTTYVSDATVGDRDSYVFGDLSTLAATVYGVQVNQYSRKDDAATRQTCTVVRQGGTDYDGATATLGTSYATFSEIRETDPSTSTAWTVSGVNSAEYGIKTVT